MGVSHGTRGPLVSSKWDAVRWRAWGGVGVEIDKLCHDPLGSPLPHPGETGSTEDRGAGETQRDKEGGK